MTTITAAFDSKDLRGIRSALHPEPFRRAFQKAGSTALRDAVRESSKRIRARKRLKVKTVREAMGLVKPRGRVDIDRMEFRIDFEGKPVPLSVYPHRAVKRGVSVTVNRGSRSVLGGAFIATMASGHSGVFKRKGKSRLPIRELLGSRPVDAMLHAGEAEAVRDRGGTSFAKAFKRLLPLEIDRARR